MKSLKLTSLLLGVLISSPVHSEPAKKEVVVRKIEMGKHRFESIMGPNNSISSELLLNVKSDGKVQGTLTLENDRRGTTCKIDGHINARNVTFTFTESVNGISGKGSITEVEKGIYKISFSDFQGSNGHNAQLFSNHSLKLKE